MTPEVQAIMQRAKDFAQQSAKMYEQSKESQQNACWSASIR